MALRANAVVRLFVLFLRSRRTRLCPGAIQSRSHIRKRVGREPLGHRRESARGGAVLLAAAKQGLARAQIKLAAGEPEIPESSVRACGWYLLVTASLRGAQIEKAQSAYERASLRLTSSRTAEVEHFAQGWKPKAPTIEAILDEPNRAEGGRRAYWSLDRPANCRPHPNRLRLGGIHLASSGPLSSPWRRGYVQGDHRVLLAVAKDGRRAPCQGGLGQGRRRRRAPGRGGADFVACASRPARAGALIPRGKTGGTAASLSRRGPAWDDRSSGETASKLGAGVGSIPKGNGCAKKPRRGSRGGALVLAR